LIVVAIGLLGGCAAAPPDGALQDRATLCLHRGMRFPDNPAVRAQSLEAAGEVIGMPAAPIIRECLGDQHAGVRFAACMALGRIRDREALDPIRRLASDADPNVRVGVYYALERLGDRGYRRAWVDLMQDNGDANVRRNAVLALGMLADARTKALLVRTASEDQDDGVRLQALEAMAMLGDSEAEGRFVRDAFGGLGYRQPFALLALGRFKDSQTISVLRSRLAYAPYLEAKLAAARGLAMQGFLDGYSLAVQSLSWNQPDARIPDDPPMNQVMRVRSMAAMALGDMGDRKALGALHRCMETTNDPRIQVAAARSILLILNGVPASAPAQ
jgi:HEAT repeat protein